MPSTAEDDYLREKRGEQLRGYVQTPRRGVRRFGPSLGETSLDCNDQCDVDDLLNRSD